MNQITYKAIDWEGVERIGGMTAADLNKVFPKCGRAIRRALRSAPAYKLSTQIGSVIRLWTIKREG